MDKQDRSRKNKQRSLRRRLTRIIESEFKSDTTKEGVLDFIDKLEDWNGFQHGEFQNFKKRVKNLEENQWKNLINQINLSINRKIDEKKKEDYDFDKLMKKIDEDGFLKHFNVNIGRNNFARYKRNNLEAKVYLACGVYFVGGSIKEIVKQIKIELKENNVNVRAFCLSCSSKKLHFIDECCLCSNCGSISNLTENKVVEKYDIKDFWQANFLSLNWANNK